MAVSSTGSGPCVVLLHGFLETMQMWNHLAGFLQERYQVVCVDLPGHGDTPAVAETHSMDLMAEMVQDVLAALEISRCTVAGHSMGGYVALALAEQAPELLAGLAMVHTTATADSEEAKGKRERSFKIIEHDRIGLVQAAIPNLFAPDNVALFPQAIAELKEQAARTTAQGIRGAQRGMRDRPDRTHVIAGLNCPVLWIVGKLDPAVPYALMPAQLNLAKDASALVLETIGHMGLVEAPVDVRFAIETFLEEIG